MDWKPKQTLHFLAKNGEQLQEEKDTAAFDNVEKGGTGDEPLNPKANNPDNAPKDTPDKKKSGDEEEKKSNGAHTPV